MNPTINIARDYAAIPGGRCRAAEPASGEGLREELLRPTLEHARTQGSTLGVELDGTRFGHPIGFLEEAFGGLVRTDKATAAELDLQGDSETAATIRRLMAEARKNTR